MATKPYKYQKMFPLGPDTTEYYHLTSDYVKVEKRDDSKAEGFYFDVKKMIEEGSRKGFE